MYIIKETSNYNKKVINKMSVLIKKKYLLIDGLWIEIS